MSISHGDKDVDKSVNVIVNLFDIVINGVRITFKGGRFFKITVAALALSVTGGLTVVLVVGHGSCGFVSVSWLDTQALSALVAAALIAAVVSIWTWHRSRQEPSTRSTDARDNSARSSPPPVWAASGLARLYRAGDLVTGFGVAAGTRMVFVDDGVRQTLELEPGDYDETRMTWLFRDHNLGPASTAIQYQTGWTRLAYSRGPLTCRDYSDVVASVEIDAALRGDCVERLLGWSVLSEDVLSAAAVEDLLGDVVGRWLESAVPAYPFVELRAGADALRDKLAAAVLGGVLKERPVSVQVRRLGFTSACAEEFAQAERLRARAASKQGLAEAEELLREAKKTRVLGEVKSWADVRERIETLLQDEELATWQRLGEREERLRYLRERLGKPPVWFPDQEREFDSAVRATPSQRDEYDAALVRQSLLERVATLRTHDATFTVEIWPVEAAAAMSDKGPQPSHLRKRWRAGEPLRLKIRSSQSGYLWVLTIGTGGDVTPLLPNPHFPSTRWIEAGTIVQIPRDSHPFELELEGPAGIEVVQVLVTGGAIPVLMNTENLDRWVGQRAVCSLDAIVGELDRMPAGTWASAAAAVEIAA